jgi:apoptotic chromatin condensation inducer in the nucleus
MWLHVDVRLSAPTTTASMGVLSEEKEAFLQSLKVEGLKAELRSRGESVSGLKAALVERLRAALEKEVSPQISRLRTANTLCTQHPKLVMTTSICLGVQAGTSDRSDRDDHDDSVREAGPDATAVTQAEEAGKAQQPEVKEASAGPPSEQKSSPKQLQQDQKDEPMSVADILKEDEADEELAHGTQQDAGASAASEPEPGPNSEPTAEAPAAEGSAAGQLAEPEEPAVVEEPVVKTEEQKDGTEARKRRAPIPLYQPRERAKAQAATQQQAEATTTVAASPTGDAAAAATPTAARSQAAPVQSKDKDGADSSPAAQKEEVQQTAQQEPQQAVRINNLVRPFTEASLRKLLNEHGTVTDMWMPSIKTHAFVIFETAKQAAACFAALQGKQWPQTSPKQLQLTYLSLEAAQLSIQHGRDPSSVPATRDRGVSRAAPPAKPAATPAEPSAPAAAAPAASATGGATQAPASTAPRSLIPTAMGLIAAKKAAMAAAHDSAAAGGRAKRGRDEEGDANGEAGKEEEEGTPAAAAPAAKRRHLAPDGGAATGAQPEGGGSPGDAAPAASAPAREVPTVSLDTLFRKTKTKPQLYWLPLTDKEVRVEASCWQKQVDVQAVAYVQGHGASLLYCIAYSL